MAVSRLKSREEVRESSQCFDIARVNNFLLCKTNKLNTMGTNKFLISRIGDLRQVILCIAFLDQDLTCNRI